MKQASLILTSSGFESNALLNEFVNALGDKTKARVAIITTASKDKEKNKYAKMSYDQLIDAGVPHVDFVDFETQPEKDLSQYKGFCVMGGNTFFLLQQTLKVGADRAIRALLDRGGVYFGVSAGSLIVQPSVVIANEVEPDPNDIGMTDFTGLNITPLTLHVHYEPKAEEDLRAFESRYKVAVVRLQNKNAVILRAPNAAGLYSAKPQFIIEGAEPPPL